MNTEVEPWTASLAEARLTGKPHFFAILRGAKNMSQMRTVLGPVFDYYDPQGLRGFWSRVFRRQPDWSAYNLSILGRSSDDAKWIVRDTRDAFERIASAEIDAPLKALALRSYQHTHFCGAFVIELYGWRRSAEDGKADAAEHFAAMRNVIDQLRATRPAAESAQWTLSRLPLRWDQEWPLG